MCGLQYKQAAWRGLIAALARSQSKKQGHNYPTRNPRRGGQPEGRQVGLEDVAATLEVVRLPAGSVVSRPGSEYGNCMFLVDCSVHVQMVAENACEIVLYRVSGGQICVMTTA